MELLSPAGNRDALIAAIQAGADAVYIGGKAFSARQSASNFDMSELVWAMDYAHERNRKVYVAVNTLIGQSEWTLALEYIHELAALGADALIMQDLGLISYAVKHLPVPVHASTQATAVNLQGAAFLKNTGVSRVILARETKLSDIDLIAKTSGVEIEVFVHGALCVSVSGQCLFSGMIGGRSGNRGRCAQPCRLPYALYNAKGNPIAQGNLLSPKDLMTINRLQELKAAGVASLKIEGRLKSTAYVYLVTKAYRMALDSLAEVAQYSKSGVNDIEKDLRLLGNRDGYTEGYAFLGDDLLNNTLMSKLPNGNIQTHSIAKRAEMEAVINSANSDFSIEKTNIALSAHASFHINAPCKLTLTEKQALEGTGLSVTVEGPIVQTAKTRGTSVIDAQKQLAKTGGTIYTIDTIAIVLDEGAYISISDLNKLRRDAIEKLRRLRIDSARSYTSSISSPRINNSEKSRQIHSNPILIVQTPDIKLSQALLDAGANHIYWHPEDFRPKELLKYDSLINSNELFGKISLVLPNYLTTRELEQIPKFQSLIAANVGQLSLQGVKASDFTLNVFNSATFDFLAERGINRITLSPELTLSQAYDIRDRSDSGELEIIAYGRIPLMTLKHCPLRASGLENCNRTGNVCSGAEFSDRRGARFPIKRYIAESGCTVRLLNSLPMSIHKRISAFSGLADAWRLMFFTENETDTLSIVRYYRALIDQKEAQLPDILARTVTSGHWFRGVE